MEGVVAEVERSEESEVAEVGRNGACQTHVGEIQGGDTLAGGIAGYANPAAHGSGCSPVV